jgi:hypothetical protein
MNNATRLATNKQADKLKEYQSQLSNILHFTGLVNLLPSPSLSLSSSTSLPISNIISPSRLSRGSVEGFCGIGAGKGEASRILAREPPVPERES